MQFSAVLQLFRCVYYVLQGYYGVVYTVTET